MPFIRKTFLMGTLFLVILILLKNKKKQQKKKNESVYCGTKYHLYNANYIIKLFSLDLFTCTKNFH